MTNEQFAKLYLWVVPKEQLEADLADLFVDASVKELIRQELARRNAWSPRQQA
jgi:hypothetical protein